jgi:hypothetical protein
MDNRLFPLAIMTDMPVKAPATVSVEAAPKAPAASALCLPIIL